MKSPVQFAAGAAVLLIAAVLLALPLTGALPNGAAASTAVAQDDRTQIRQLVELWADAYRAGDAGRLGAVYSPDAVSVRESAAPLAGRQAILNAATAEMAAFRFAVTVDLHDIGFSGNTAWAIGRVAMKAEPRTKGAGADYGSQYMAVFTRGPDGRWRIHRDVQRQGPALFAEAS